VEAYTDGTEGLFVYKQPYGEIDLLAKLILGEDQLIPIGLHEYEEIRNSYLLMNFFPAE